MNGSARTHGNVVSVSVVFPALKFSIHLTLFSVISVTIDSFSRSSRTHIIWIETSPRTESPILVTSSSFFSSASDRGTYMG